PLAALANAGGPASTRRRAANDRVPAGPPGRRPMLGTFKDGRGTFYSPDQLDGKPIRCRFIFSNLTAGPASEEQAFSSDGGKTWEVNWINTATAAKATPAPQR